MKIVYIAIGALIGIYLFKKMMAANMDYRALMAKGAIIIDVRTPQEFDGGNIKGSKNIPLGQIAQRAADLKEKNVPIICVCASGMRSGNACSILKKAGVECYNGGGWSSLNNKL
jgi:phage shock protein E